MTRQEVLEQFRQGFDCSQVVLMAFAEELGYDEEELARMGAAFGGGMHHGDTCGAVIGALIALGMQFGNASAGEFHQKEEMNRKVKAFQEAFIERLQSTLCRDLIGFDMAVEGDFEKTQESGVILEKCPICCTVAIEEAQRLMVE